MVATSGSNFWWVVFEKKLLVQDGSKVAQEGIRDSVLLVDADRVVNARRKFLVTITAQNNVK